VLGSARGSGASTWFGSAPVELQRLLLAMLVARVRIPLIADTHSRLIADSVPDDRGHPG
jgi:hypothetical protein